MKNVLKVVLLASTLGLSTTLSSCNLAIGTSTKETYYNINLISNEFVNLKADNTNLKKGEEARIEATLLNNNYQLVGIEVSNNVEVTKVEGTENTFTFIMPDTSVSVKGKLVEKIVPNKITGKFLCANGLTETSSNNNTLVIDDKLNFTLTRNDDFKNSIKGTLNLNDTNYTSKDNTFIVIPVFDKEENLSFLVAKYFDSKANHSDYMVFENNNFPKVLNTSKSNHGVIVEIKLNSNNDVHWFQLSEETFEEVQFNNFNKSFNTETIYELVNSKGSLYFMYDGTKLFENSRERGTYLLTNASKEFSVVLDGFGKAHYGPGELSEEHCTYDYFDDGEFIHLNLKDGTQLLYLDYLNHQITQENIAPTNATGIVYTFKTNELPNHPSVNGKLYIKENTFIDLDVDGAKLCAYELIDNKLTIEFSDHHLIKFSYDPKLQIFTHLDGYFLVEGDADGVVLNPTCLDVTIMVEGEMHIFEQNGYVNHPNDNGQMAFSSYSFTERNGELEVIVGFAPRPGEPGTGAGHQVKIDFVKQTGIKTEIWVFDI